MTLTSKPLAVIILVILFGGILGSSALGLWQTESNKQAARYDTGEYAGEANPADIRGSYTFGDVENNFGIPASLLTQAFGMESADPASLKVKDLESFYADSPEEVGTASVRLFVAFYKNLPFDLGSDIYLPESAAAILRAQALSAEQASYLETHTIGAAKPAPAPDSLPEATPEAMSTAEATEHTPAGGNGSGDGSGVGSERMVKGKTTFAEVLDWGVSRESIERVLGMGMPAAPGIKIRDFCAEKGLAFETVRIALQAEVDKVTPAP